MYHHQFVTVFKYMKVYYFHPTSLCKYIFYFIYFYDSTFSNVNNTKYASMRDLFLEF